MPTYEYQCGTCDNRFEKYQSFSDEPIKVCPECGNAVRKVISAAGIIFKGSGWYVNDSRKKSSSSESKPEVKAETGSETKAEATPETKTEAAPASAPAAEAKPEAKPETKSSNKEAAA